MIKLREVDAYLAKHLFLYPAVGYYKRESRRTSNWVRCSEGEVTEDSPDWKADLYYSYSPECMVTAVPLYTTDRHAAWQIVEHLAYNYDVSLTCKDLVWTFCIVDAAGDETKITSPNPALAIAGAAFRFIGGEGVIDQ